MPRSDYLEILDEAEAAESRGDVWDLDAEADRLGVALADLPLDEKGWERAVSVAYRRRALRAHPDKGGDPEVFHKARGRAEDRPTGRPIDRSIDRSIEMDRLMDTHYPFQINQSTH